MAISIIGYLYSNAHYRLAESMSEIAPLSLCDGVSVGAIQLWTITDRSIRWSFSLMQRPYVEWYEKIRKPANNDGCAIS